MNYQLLVMNYMNGKLIMNYELLVMNYMRGK
jgi:hypothetical protein